MEKINNFRISLSKKIKNMEEKNMSKNKFKILKVLAVVLYTAFFMFVNGGIVFATDDPLTVINNLSTFIFGIIRAVGMIILGFGIVQVGLSLKSHDPAQRANGVMTVAGGVIITFAKEILNLITGG